MRTESCAAGPPWEVGAGPETEVEAPAVAKLVNEKVDVEAVLTSPTVTTTEKETWCAMVDYARKSSQLSALFWIKSGTFTITHL